MYIRPQVEVYQEFSILPAAATAALRPWLVGPDYQLVRYANSSEKALGLLGAYDPDSEACLAWPEREAGAVVDLAYTRINIDDALLQYFSSSQVSSAAVVATYADVDVGGYKNRVRSGLINWKTSAAADRHSGLKQRDVQLGDWVKVAGVVDGEVVTQWNYVSGFVNDDVAAQIVDSFADELNQSTVTATSSQSQTAGDVNLVDIDSIDGSLYDGLETGDVAEAYTVEVVTGGAPAAAILRVTSASGNDDVAEVVPEDFGSPTAIGTRGLTATFALGSADISSTPEDELFVAGQTWVINVRQAFTAPVVTPSGDYTGAADTSYIVEVTKGGKWADAPEVMVSSTTGIDNGGPYAFAAGGGGSDTVAIGSYGISIAFNAAGLSQGDRYYVEVAAVSAGAIKTLVLGKSLPAGLLGFDDAGVMGTPPDLTVTLFIKKNIELTKNRAGYAPLTNWSASATEICLKDGALSTDASWVDADGNLLPLAVKGGTAYVTYRAFRQRYVNAVSSAQSVGDLSTLFVAVDSENPLPYAAGKAMANANGTPVLFTAIADNSIASWQAALNLATVRDDIYGMVPLTFDRAVRDLFVAHAVALSGPSTGRWRKVFASAVGPSQLALLTASNGKAVLATVTDDPNTSGDQYTVVETVMAEVDAVNFSALGVRAGDILRAEFRSDGFDGVTYSEYVIDALLSADSLRLVAGPAMPISVASKIEIWRTLDADGLVTAVKAEAGSFGTRRYHHVWPDYPEAAGVQVPGYHLAAALAGAVGGVAPHQGLTHLEIVGFSGVGRTTNLLSETQLDSLAESGVWIVTQDPQSLKIYTRHALTTDMTDINRREEVITRNVDSISYLCLRELEPFIGRANISPDMLAQLSTELESVLSFIESALSTKSLGPQLLGHEIVSLAQHPTLKDRVVAVVNLTLPYPMNNLQLHLVI